MNEIEGMPRKFGTYVYVSCWTSDSEENIALWKMYSGNMRGIRISFPSSFFIQEKISAGDYNGYEFSMDFISPLRLNALRTEDSVVLNNFNDPNSFFKEVVYDDNYSYHYKAITRDDGRNLTTLLYELGKYKSKRWEFQKECRFTIYRIPLLALNHPSVNYDRRKQLDLASDIILHDISNTDRYLDIEIDEAAFNSIIVTLGPLSQPSDKIIVESLLSRFTSNAQLADSSLKGSIRE